MKNKLLLICAVLGSASAAVGLTACFGGETGGGHTHVYNRDIAEENYLAAPASCTDRAQYYYSCECGEAGTDVFEYGDYGAHSYGAYTADNNATCVDNGTETAVCSVCNGRDVRVIPNTATGVHNFVNYIYNDDATCVKNGTKTGSCQHCDATDTVEAEDTATGRHTYGEWVADGNATCIENGTETAKCQHCEATDTREKADGRLFHKYENGECTVCGSKRTEGLEYTYYSRGDYYIVTGIGSAKDPEIFIPDEYNNKPVKSVKGSAFAGCKFVKSITVSDGITEVGNSAFSKCTSLESLTLGRGFTDNGGYIVNGCTKLKEIRYTGDLQGWCAIRGTGFDVQNCKLYIGGERVMGDVVVPDGVKSVVDFAFAYEGITSLTIPQSVKKIGRGIVSGTDDVAVYYGGTLSQWCELDNSGVVKNGFYSLYIGGERVKGNVVVPEGVTKIGGYAFSYIDGIVGVTLPQSLKTIGRAAFSNCYALERITIPDGVTVIEESAFKSCSSLTSITIPDSVTSIGSRAFEYCSSLTSITIPDSVTSIGNSAFANCSSLTGITLPDGITVIGEYLFNGCSSLTDFIIPESVTKISQGAFASCSSLTSITIPDSVTIIGNDAFKYSHALTVYCDAASKPESWGTNWNGGCIVVWNGTQNDEDENGCKYTAVGGVKFELKDGAATVISCADNATQAVIPSVVTYKDAEYPVTGIKAKAFNGCDRLVSLLIPESVTSVGEKILNNNELTVYCEAASKPEGWHDKWDDLIGIGFPVVWNCKQNDKDDNGLAYTVVDGIRYSLASGVAEVLEQNDYVGGNIIIPAKITYEGEEYVVSEISSTAFNGCDSLKSITIPESVTEIGAGAFGDCSKLENIFVNENNTAYKSVDGSLYSKDGKTLVRFPINKKIISFTVPDGVTTIDINAFNRSIWLKTVTLPETVTAINDYAFYMCRALKKVNIPDGVKSISGNAFGSCSALESITISVSVTSIGFHAFMNSSALTSINFEGTKAQWTAISKGESWDKDTGEYTIHCTDGDIAKS